MFASFFYSALTFRIVKVFFRVSGLCFTYTAERKKEKKGKMKNPPCWKVGLSSRYARKYVRKEGETKAETETVMETWNWWRG